MDASEAIICSFHTASLHSSRCLSAPCVVYILFHLRSIQTSFSAVFLGGFVSTSLTTNAVQQGDIERASLQRENKQFVIRCNQGQRLLPPAQSICADANETSAYVGCLFFSRTDGMMSLHDEDASGGWALCLFMCDRVHTVSRLLHFINTAR